MSDGEFPVIQPGDPSFDVSGRARLDIAYDGTDFSGWAVQPGRRTVQGVLQDALAQVLRTPVALTVAGRTDAGVHATGQVAHADLPAFDDSLLRRLTGVLPPDVRVRSVRVVTPEFDARFGALWRRYEYRLTDDPAGADPLRRAFVLSWRRSLDVPAMAQAAAGLLGEHDFVAFCKHREGAGTVRALQEFTVRRDGGEIVCRLRADAFCHSMVRSLIGALLAVGEGRRVPEWPAGLFARSVRADEVGVVPPHGLVLVEVGYPPDEELAARAAVTRNRRTLT